MRKRITLKSVPFRNNLAESSRTPWIRTTTFSTCITLEMINTSQNIIRSTPFLKTSSQVLVVTMAGSSMNLLQVLENAPTAISRYVLDF